MSVSDEWEGRQKCFRTSTLLVEGGKYLLLEFIKARTSSNVDDLLTSTKSTIIDAKLRKQPKPIITNLQYDILFPTNGGPSDLTQWDITLASCIITNCITLNPTEKANIKDIRDLRNKLVGHASTLSMTDSEFKNNWTDITVAFEATAKCISNDVVNDIKKLIEDIDVRPMCPKDCLDIIMAWHQWENEVERKMNEVHHEMVEIHADTKGIIQTTNEILHNFSVECKTGRDERKQILDNLTKSFNPQPTGPAESAHEETTDDDLPCTLSDLKNNLEGALKSVEKLMQERGAKQKDQKTNSGTPSQRMFKHIVTCQREEVEQNEKRYHESLDVWDELGSTEQISASKDLIKFPGIHNVICIDISDSMRCEDKWEQAETFVNHYLNGLDANPDDMKDDNVALVTFGHETRIVQRLTKDISEVRKAFDNLKLGGPSPMYGGLVMAEAAAQSSSVLTIVNGTVMYRKIILITDGYPTDEKMFAGPDDDSDSETQLKKTKGSIIRKVAQFQKDKMDLYCVPVGSNSNLNFLKQLKTISDGKLLNYKDGQKLSRTIILTAMVNQMGTGLTPSIKDLIFSKSDKEQLQELANDAKKKMKDFGEDKKTDVQSNIHDGGHSTKKFPVEMVQSKDHQFHHSFQTWDNLGKEELKKGRQIQRELGGIHNILCIDISESMADGDAWTQARTFVEDYIHGLEQVAKDFDTNADNVALVTFGHDTSIVRRLTRDYHLLLRDMEDIKLGGPSPMYGGVALAVAAAKSTVMGAMINGIEMYRKVILITDGKPTDLSMYAGSDERYDSEIDEIEAATIRQVSTFQRTKIELNCVPVGNANTGFLDNLVEVAQGKTLQYNEGSNLAYVVVLNVLAKQDGSELPDIGYGLSNLAEKLKEVREDGGRRDRMRRQTENQQYIESDGMNLISIGTRVRRGSNWHYGNQDGDGPGTVIGHHASGQQLWVEWDAGEQTNIYCHGQLSGYDLQVVAEPRIIPNGRLIAVGCVVKQGPDWQDGHGPEKAEEDGVVIRMLGKQKVLVRWNNGQRGEYSYGEDGVYEVKLGMPLVLRDYPKPKVRTMVMPEAKFYKSLKDWDVMRSEELDNGKQCLNDVLGIHSVLCVDISASMAEGDAWKEAFTFISDFINGLGDRTFQHDVRVNHAALVTFGHETKVVHRLTNDFSNFLQHFENIILCGPTPLYGGIAMAMAAAENGQCAEICGKKMPRRIILITDGNVTDGKMYAGPDEVKPGAEVEAQDAIFEQVELLKSIDTDLFCVPAGSANKDFLEKLTSKADGQMLGFDMGRTLATGRDERGVKLRIRMPGGAGRSNSKEIMKVIQREDDEYSKYTSSTGLLLPIGARVTRGVDWSYAEHNDCGSGTVTGHSDFTHRLCVQWDNCQERNLYHYSPGKYDVVAAVGTDAQRKLPADVKIAVGCAVKPGPKWDATNTQFNECQQGVVVKLLPDTKVQVFWENGQNGEYSYDGGENNEVEIIIPCDSESPSSPKKRKINEIT